jgi:hypothetical protein
MNAWSSPAYRIWVIGGLATIVGVSVVLGLNNPNGQWIIFVVLGMLAVFFAGMFAFQGHAARQLSRGEVPTGEDGEPAHGADPPKGWQEMSRTLALGPVDAAAERSATAGMGGFMMGQVRYGALLCAAILICVGLFYAGANPTWYPLGDTGPGFPIVFVPIFVLIIYGVLRIPFTMADAASAGNEYLKPLGLAITQMPKVGARPRYGGSGLQTDVRGPTVMEGTRHGRRVRIELEGGEYHTALSGASSSFRVKGEGGRLSAGERTPKSVRKALEPLSADRRWKSVEARGGADGIVVERRIRGKASEQLWMDDLWLAERLAEAAGSDRKAG